MIFLTCTEVKLNHVVTTGECRIVDDVAKNNFPLVLEILTVETSFCTPLIYLVGQWNSCVGYIRK